MVAISSIKPKSVGSCLKTKRAFVPSAGRSSITRKATTCTSDSGCLRDTRGTLSETSFFSTAPAMSKCTSVSRRLRRAPEVAKSKRVIPRKPTSCNYYLVDANFLVNRYLKPAALTDAKEKERITLSLAWWAEINAQLGVGTAKIYVPDVCIAEAFKTLAKKYYEQKFFKYPANYKNARDALRKDIHLPQREARKQHRTIRFHDVDTTRDVVISVDRFFEKAYKLKVSVGIIDLLLLATAKYLTDFFGFSDDELLVITMDGPLYKLARSMSDVPRSALAARRRQVQPSLQRM